MNERIPDGISLGPKKDGQLESPELLGQLLILQKHLSRYTQATADPYLEIADDVQSLLIQRLGEMLLKIQTITDGRDAFDDITILREFNESGDQSVEERKINLLKVANLLNHAFLITQDHKDDARKIIHDDFLYALSCFNHVFGPYMEEEIDN